MGNLKRNYNRFMVKNRNKGIPNLMLWIGLGNLLVYLYCMLGTKAGAAVYNAICFDAAQIAQGQVWRLISFVFTYAFDYMGSPMSLFFVLLSVYFYYWLGKMLENSWGTLRLNMYYLSGVLLTGIVALLVYLIFGVPVLVSAYYINLSLFLAVATLAPEQRVLVFFVIPVKMRWMALVDIGMVLYSILTMVLQLVVIFPLWLALVIAATAPLVSFLNYFLFFRGDVRGLFTSKPLRPRQPKARPWKPEMPRGAKVQDMPNTAANNTARPYRHKCTVCGRTDTECPGLEFRYCSKCAGYFCYCIDHINNHTHIQ